MNRQRYNLELIDLLEMMVAKHPELRMGQILTMYGVIDYDKEALFSPKWKNEFYLESEDLLERVKKKFNEENQK